MSSLHLTTGSQLPPKVDGKLRLYSMEYCPYAQRSRLVLLAKNIPHDIVNVNLTNKPEWLFNIHPEGKVPALDIGSRIVVESLDICDYLDQEYADPPLYPAEPHAREADKALIQKIGPLTTVFTNLILGKEKKTAEEWLKELLPHLNNFETVLEKRGLTFFGGEKPGMVDYMLWPWAERAGSVTLALNERLPLTQEQLPLLRTWRKVMRTQPAVEAIYHGPETFNKLVKHKVEGTAPDYDNI